MIELSDEKYVEIKWDHEATALWDSEGKNLRYEAIPISKELITDLKLWVKAYTAYSDYVMLKSNSRLKDFDHPTCPQMNIFSQWAEELAKRVKKELPKWTVIFFDSRRIYNTENEIDYIPDDVVEDDQ